MMAAQIAIVTGLRRTTATEALIALPMPTGRSSSSGKDTTLMTKASAAKAKPTAWPTKISRQPASVVSTDCTKPLSEAGPASPMMRA